MKKLSATLSFILLLSNCFAQNQPPRLIVRGDDMGFSHSGNLALIKCFKEGIEKSIEVIVPSPWFPEAVKMLKENPGVDIGIHLAITSEWDNVKWRPLSDCPSLKDSNGYFYPKVVADKAYPGQAIKENKWTIQDVEKEWRAQIELAKKLIPNITHLSAHMGCTGLSAETKALVKRLSKEYNIPVDPDTDVQGWVGYDGPHQTAEDKINSFIKMLDKLQPGKSYIFLDHPGIDDDELKAIHHIGYENVAADRQGVTDLFTSEKVKAAIKQKGIVLIGYGDLVK